MHRPVLAALLFVACVPATGCARFYARMISTKVVADQRALESYRGTYVERFPASRDAAPGQGPRQEIVREVRYRAPSQIRVEVMEPAEHAGELIVYDGDTMCMYFPRERVGVRIAGAEAPTPGQLRRLVTEDTLWSWDNYAYSYRGRESTAGREVGHWKAVPKHYQPLLFPYEAWTDLEYSLPLRVEIRDSPTRPWYEMAFTEVAFDAPVDPAAFSCEMPEGTWVMDWDLDEPGVRSEDLRERLDFDLLVPEDLPLGLELRRVLEGTTGAPMAALLMDDDGRWLTLTESHGFGRALEPGAGIPIRVGEEAGTLNLMGSFSSLSWYAGNTALTLVGNLPYPEMARVAASIQPPEGTRVGDLLAIDGYRGVVEERCPACTTPRVVRSVDYARGSLRVEVVEPPERAGEVLVWDGETMAMHWPRMRMGVRVRGSEAPTEEQLRAMLKEDGLWALHRYDHTWEGSEERAGRLASHWRSTPAREGADMLPYETWLDRDTAIPLAWEVEDRDGALFYATELRELDLEAAPQPGRFDLDFPEGTRVFDWDLAADSVALEQRDTLGFDVLLPGALPMGLEVRKVVKHADLPVVNVLMGSGARWLSLSEARHWGGPVPSGEGMPVAIGGREGRLELVGGWSTVSWAVGNTALTLIGNLPYQEMVAIAASIQPEEGSWSAQDPLTMGSFEGRIEETLAGADRPVVRDVRYQQDGRIRVEVVEPASRRSELFLYDGETLTMWWPQHLTGVRIRGVQAPEETQLRASWEQDALWTLHNFDLAYEGEERVAERAVDRWDAKPVRDAPALHPYRAWLDRSHALPLAVELGDPDAPIYAMAYERLEPASFDEADFAFHFPANAVVFDWDLGDPHQPLEQLRHGMNFRSCQPTVLPDGVQVTKTVRGRHALPMAVTLMEGEHRWLSLTQARRLPGALDRSLGVPVEVDGHPGVLVFAGTFSSLSWNQGNTALTLVGNLPYPQLLEVAEGVEAL